MIVNYYASIVFLAGNLTGWVAFRLEDVETEEKSKTRAEKNKDEKEEKILKHENPHLLGGFSSWPFLTTKLGVFEIFD